MIDAGVGVATLVMAVPGAVGLASAGCAGFPVAAGAVDGTAAWVAAVAAVLGGVRVACGVGKPAFCKVMVALPSGWPMKLGMTKAWGEAS